MPCNFQAAFSHIASLKLSPKVENFTPGAHAEWLLQRALGLNPVQHLVEWAEVHITYDSITLELKSAAFVQSWHQKNPSTISFPIELRVPTAKLHDELRSIGLQPLLRAYGEGLRFKDLAARIKALRQTVLDASSRTAWAENPC